MLGSAGTEVAERAFPTKQFCNSVTLWWGLGVSWPGSLFQCLPNPSQSFVILIYCWSCLTSTAEWLFSISFSRSWGNVDKNVHFTLFFVVVFYFSSDSLEPWPPLSPHQQDQNLPFRPSLAFTKNLMAFRKRLGSLAALPVWALDFWGLGIFFYVLLLFSKFTGSVDTKLLQLVLLCQWISTSSQVQEDGESSGRKRKGVAMLSHLKHIPIHTDVLRCCVWYVMNIALFCFPRMSN